MKTHILDLDGSMTSEGSLQAIQDAQVYRAQNWGPRIRLACSFRRFRRFERELESWRDHLLKTAQPIQYHNETPLTPTLSPEYRGEGESKGVASVAQSFIDSTPALTFIGSGDFHHVSLALVRQQRAPINLLVIDNHPDWMRFVPFLHCGTWLYHAACLPQVERVFHVGGDVDFDNYYQWMAPWSLLRSRKIKVLPAIRQYQRGAWSGVANEPVRVERKTPATLDRLEALLHPFRAELAGRPLYISLDKDVMTAQDAIVNWDSGHLTLPEVESILHAFVGAAHGQLAGMDVVGDWSPVRVQGGLRRLMHWIMHPALQISPEAAVACNQRLNHKLLDLVTQRGAANRRA